MCLGQNLTSETQEVCAVVTILRLDQSLTGRVNYFIWLVIESN